MRRVAVVMVVPVAVVIAAAREPLPRGYREPATKRGERQTGGGVNDAPVSLGGRHSGQPDDQRDRQRGEHMASTRLQ
jgi:hypothetical protein